MPIVELDIGGTPRKFQVSEGYTPEDLDHIVQSVNAPIGPAATTDTPTSGVMGAVSQGTRYVGRKALEWQKAADTMLGGLQSTAPPDNPPTDPWEIAGQTATALAPAIAPGLMVAGTGAGAVTRAAGGSEGTADLVNAGTQLAGGVANAAISAGRAVKNAPAALKAASQAKYGVAAEQAAKAGKTLAMGTQAGDAFAQTLDEALDSALTHPAEKAMGRTLLNKMTAPGSPGITYGDLDDAMAGLRKVRGQSYVRGLVDDAAQSLLEGTPAGKARLAGKAMYRSLKTKPFKVGGNLALGVAGGTAAAEDVAHGNYKRAGLTLAGTALAGAGLSRLTGRGLMTAAGGAAGPLARTAVAVGGQVPGLDLGGGGGGDETQPADIGTAAPAAPETPPPSPANPSARIQPLAGPYGRELAAVSHLVGVPAPLLQGVMKQESGGNPNALSHPELGQAQTPAHGLMQITPGTFATVAPQVSKLVGRTADLANPFDNILASGLLWRRYLDKSNGDVGVASKMYFGGENPSAWGSRTEQYSRDIDRQYARAAAAAGPGPAPAAPSGRSGWQTNLDQRVAAGYITPEQAAAEGGG